MRALGSFHVGGGLVRLTGMPVRQLSSIRGGPTHTTDSDGELAAGQMYAQYVRLAEPRGRLPVLMWHGGGMSGVNWETTPDGRDGWQMLFLRAGLDVFVCDAVERARASWATYPQVYTGEPFFRTAREAWEVTFRFGPAGSWDSDPARRRAHPGLRFPVGAIDQFMKQSQPRSATMPPRTGAGPRKSAQRNSAAAAAPELCVGLGRVGRTRGVEHHDRHQLRRGVASVPNVRRWHQALIDADVNADWLDLPAREIRGNSHAMMMDDNHEQIAELVLGWLESHGLLARG